MGITVAVDNLSVLADGDYDESKAMDVVAFVAASCLMPMADASEMVFGKRSIAKARWNPAVVCVGLALNGLAARYEGRLRLNPATKFDEIAVETEILSVWHGDRESLVMGKIHDGIMVLNRDRLCAGEEAPYDLVVKGVEWSGLSLANEPVGQMLRPFVTRLTANLPTKASADLPQSI